MTEPTISVVMAVFNGERFIAEALASIFAQTRPPTEVIVIDDGSTDRTADVVSRFPGVIAVRQPNTGQATALNRGVQRASGALLCFLDADDLWMPDKLEAQAAALRLDPALDMVFGHAQELLEHTGERRAPRPAHLPGAMMIRATRLAAVGGFDPGYTLGSVVDWFARAEEAGLRHIMLPSVVLTRRIHDANIGITGRQQRDDYLRVVKAALDRRRGSTGS